MESPRFADRRRARKPELCKLGKLVGVFQAYVRNPPECERIEFRILECPLFFGCGEFSLVVIAIRKGPRF